MTVPVMQFDWFRKRRIRKKHDTKNSNSTYNFKHILPLFVVIGKIILKLIII